MAGISLTDAQARLDDWMAADAAVARNQSYSIGDRALTRADAKEIRANIVFWNDMVIGLSRSGAIRVRGAVPING